MVLFRRTEALIHSNRQQIEVRFCDEAEYSAHNEHRPCRGTEVPCTPQPGKAPQWSTCTDSGSRRGTSNLKHRNKERGFSVCERESTELRVKLSFNVFKTNTFYFWSGRHRHSSVNEQLQNVPINCIELSLFYEIMKNDGKLVGNEQFFDWFSNQKWVFLCKFLIFLISYQK